MKKNLSYFFWFFLVLLFVFTVSFHTAEREWSQDLGRHIRLGEMIFTQREIPRVNLFSYTYPDFPFFNHHWLSEVSFYLVFRLFGENGLIIFKTMVLLFAFGVVYWLLAKKTSRPLLIAFSSLLPILVFRGRTDIRPEIFGLLFFSLFLLIFEKAKRDSRWLWLLPVLQCLWVNFHISFVFGFLLLFLYFCQNRLWQRGKISLLIPIVAACFASLINPYGVKGALAPVLIWQNYGYSIAENQSIFFLLRLNSNNPGMFFWPKLALGVVFLSFLLSKRILSVDFFGWAIFSVLACFQVRHFPFWALYSFWVLGINYSVLWERLNDDLRKKITLPLGLFTGLVIVFYVCFYSTNFYYRINDLERRFGLNGRQPFKEGVNFLLTNFPQKKIFNNFDVGSYLDFFYPEIRVFADSRPEAYPVEFWEEYQEIQFSWDKWQETVEKDNIEVVFFSHTDQTPWAKSFLKALYQNKDWRLVYLDGQVAIFTILDWPETNADRWENLVDSRSADLLRLANFFYTVDRLDLAEETAEIFLKQEPNSRFGNLLLSAIYWQTDNSALNFKGELLRAKTKKWWYYL